MSSEDVTPPHEWRELTGSVFPASAVRDLRRTIMALPTTIHRADEIQQSPMLE